MCDESKRSAPFRGRSRILGQISVSQSERREAQSWEVRRKRLICTSLVREEFPTVHFALKAALTPSHLDFAVFDINVLSPPLVTHTHSIINTYIQDGFLRLPRLPHPYLEAHVALLHRRWCRLLRCQQAPGHGCLDRGGFQGPPQPLRLVSQQERYCISPWIGIVVTPTPYDSTSIPPPPILQVRDSEQFRILEGIVDASIATMQPRSHY